MTPKAAVLKDDLHEAMTALGQAAKAAATELALAAPETTQIRPAKRREPPESALSRNFSTSQPSMNSACSRLRNLGPPPASFRMIAVMAPR